MNRKLLLIALLQLVFFAVLPVLVFASPREDAYLKNYCAETAKWRDKFNADVYWLTAREIKLSEKTAEDYFVSRAVAEALDAEYQKKCLNDLS